MLYASVHQHQRYLAPATVRLTLVRRPLSLPLTCIIAFILYRQHHQSQVTADNPKLSNPEISKIIGEKWKHEAEAVKETWKKLAEEEKQRHQHQYPNYRYQPRRGSKVQGSWPNTPSGEESGRCMKCNGRTIATPRTPSTPVATPPSVKIGQHGQPTLHRLDTSTPRRLSMELSPVSTLPMPHQQLPPVRGYEDDPTSPDAKRRRANGAGNYHAVSRLHGAFSDGPTDSMRASPESSSYSTMRPYPPNTFTELSTIPRSHSGPMPPPPRPPGAASWVEQEPTRRHSGFDESLRLPPLQTAVSPSPVRAHKLDMRQSMLSSPVFALPVPQEKRSSSIEEAVMAIPFKRKLSVLSRVSRPLSVPSGELARSPVEPRGALIAVEGPNPQMLHNVGQAVENALLACSEVSLRSWVPDSGTVVETVDSKLLAPETSFLTYLHTIISWQEKTKQITAHVTGMAMPDSSSATDSRQTGRRDAGTVKGTEASTGPSPSSKIPVALMKDGYSLTLSDKFACSTPNSDMYSPQDHWQWMASMWRGTPNADLVVYVQPSDDDEIKKSGAVECVKRMGLLVVRIARGTTIDEATERRMAFELVEWMRDGGFQNIAPPNWRDD